MRRYLCALFSLAMFAALPALSLAQEKDHSPYGLYEIEKGMRGDQTLPEERLEKSMVKVSENRIELLDEQGNASYVITFKVDEEGDPLKLSMEIIKSADMPDAVGAKAKGLARIDGEEVTLIYDFAEGADYPKDFTPKSDTQHLFVLEKEDENDDDDDENEVAGTFAYVKGVKAGQPIPEENLAGSVKVTKDQLTLLGPAGEQYFVFSYKVDESGNPRKLSMEILKSSIMPDSVGSKAKGLIKHEGGQVYLVYDYAPDAGYPEDFSAKAETQNLFVLKRTSGDDDDKDDDKKNDDKDKNQNIDK